VATNGNDSNPGTLASPFRTIAKGTSAQRPGDTLYIRGGTYTEPVNVTSIKGGTAALQTTVSRYGSETVIIRPSAPCIAGTYGDTTVAYITFDGLICDGTGAGNQQFWTIWQSHHITFRNGEIKNWTGNGIFITDTHDIHITNNKIHDQVTMDVNRWYGLYICDTSNSIIEGNDIYNNPGGGIQIYNGTNNNNIIRGNLIHGNDQLSTSIVGGITVYSQSDNTQIYNNVIYGNGTESATYSPGITVGSGPTNTKIWNNTIYGNLGYGIQIYPGSPNNIVKNNIVINNKNGAIDNQGAATVISNNLSVDPSFVNAAASDFRLQSGSAAIDAGTDLSSFGITTDINGLNRPRGLSFDIGAYEY
jgi:parallel beta-helix repeat protein